MMKRSEAYEKLGPVIVDKLDRYVENHEDPGQFLRSFLSNDLLGAIVARDFGPRLELWPVLYLYIVDHVPYDSRGSMLFVYQWIIEKEKNDQVDPAKVVPA